MSTLFPFLRQRVTPLAGGPSGVSTFLLLAVFLCLFPFQSHAVSPPPLVSVYPAGLNVGDVVAANGTTVAVVSSGVVYEVVLNRITISNASELYSTDASYVGPSHGNVMFNWCNPNGSACYDSFVYAKFVLLSYDANTGLSTFETHFVVYQVQISDAAVTVPPLSLDQFTTLFSGSKPKNPFTNISAQIQRLDVKVAKMEPTVITQSISFLIGAFTSIAFVISSRKFL